MTANESTTRVVSESGSDVGPGQRLREAREAAQLTLAEVASRMRLDPHVLEQLENDDYERLHGPTFVRGYLSGYARLLDLPERPILEAYERHGYGPPALVSEVGRKPEVHVSDFPVRMVTYVIAGLLVLLVVLWWQSQQLQTGDLERADIAGESVQQTFESPTDDGGRTDSSAASPADPPAADIRASMTPPAVKAAAPPAIEASSEPASRGDTQPPQPTMDGEQTSASGAAHMQAPPRDDALVGATRPNAEATAEDHRTSTVVAAEAANETAVEATSEIGGETDNRAERVVATLDLAEGDTTTSPSNVEEEAAPAPRPAPLPGSDVLAIQFARESWVEIYDRGGGRLYYSLAGQGSEIVVRGAGPMRVLLGDVEGAEVAYNGEPYDLSRYQGRSVVRFTIGELSGTTTQEPPAPGAEEPLTRETREPTVEERGPSVADASVTLIAPAPEPEPEPEPATPTSAPAAEPVPEIAPPPPTAGALEQGGFQDTRPDS